MVGSVDRRASVVCALAGVVLSLAGCSSTVRLEVLFVVPKSAAGAVPAPLDEGKFHLVGAKACPLGPVTVPRPGPEPGDATYFRAKAVDGGIHAVAVFRGNHCTLQVTGWYDTDGDGAVGPGDYTGASKPTEVKDGGPFSDNISRAPDVTFALVP